jgi:hypothetical protein
MPTCRVHILSSSANGPYSSTTFNIGEHVQQEDYDRFKDERGELYVLVYVDDGKPNSRVVPRDAWYQAKAAIDQHRAETSSADEIKSPLDDSLP